MGLPGLHHGKTGTATPVVAVPMPSGAKRWSRPWERPGAIIGAQAGRDSAQVVRDTRPTRWDPDRGFRSTHSFGDWTRQLAALAESALTVEEALESTLRLACDRTGWPLGHAVLYEPAEPPMTLTEIWVEAGPEGDGSLMEASRALVGAGRGVADLVLHTGEPVWIDRLGPPGLLRAAAGYPITGSERVEGVMEFFLDEPVAPGSELHEMMFLIGAHLGGTIERQRTVRSARTDERFRRLIEQAPDAVFAVDSDGRIQVVNAEAERLSGRRRDELIGSTIDMLVPEHTRLRHKLHRDAYEAEPRRRHIGGKRDLLLLRQDGSTVPVDISLSPVDETGSGLVVAVVRDITERRTADEAVKLSEARLAEAQRIAHVGSWSWEPGSEDVLCSAEMRRIHRLGGGDGPVATRDLAESIHPDDRERLWTTVQRSAATTRPFDEEYRVVMPTGRNRWVRSRGWVTEGDAGGAARLGGFCQDITEQRDMEESRRRAADELADHQLTLERIARGEPLGKILETICLGVEKRHPGSHCSVLLVDEEEQILRLVAAPTLPAEWSNEIDRVPIARGVGACGTAAASGETVVVESIAVDDLTRSAAPLAARCGLESVWSLPLISSSGAVIGTIAMYRQETHRPLDDERAVVAAAGNLAALAIERHLNERALGLAAQVDPLTQLPNRARFLQEVEQRLESGRDRITVMFLDLDRFKWVNDSLGHPAGDRILVEAANRLRAVVGGRNMVARFGGDEFTVMLTNSSPTRVLATAERIEQAFAVPFELDGGEFFLSVSIGIATGGEEAHAMIRDADAAMYEAKERRRGRHAWFDERLRHRATERLQAESTLRRAIERSEFVLHYQPIADLATGCWTGVEALVRWARPDGTLVAPMEFIPLAEETGLILPLGSTILKSALAEVADLGLSAQGLTVAVNVSPLQLSNPGLVEEVAKLLSTHDLPPDCLVMELTESALMEDYDSALAVLHEITSLGASVVIDDFGTGYSSVSRLTELPVGGVKVDRSFTARIGTDPTVDAVLAAIIDLAHAIGLTVVAEGIESESALRLLHSLGCDSGQGYYLACPMPSHQLIPALQEPAASYR